MPPALVSVIEASGGVIVGTAVGVTVTPGVGVATAATVMVAAALLLAVLLSLGSLTTEVVVKLGTASLVKLPDNTSAGKHVPADNG